MRWMTSAQVAGMGPQLAAEGSVKEPMIVASAKDQASAWVGSGARVDRDLVGLGWIGLALSTVEGIR